MKSSDAYPTLNRADAIAAIEMARELISKTGPNRLSLFETEIIELSPKAQEKFAELLLNPPEPSAGLRHAFARHRQLIRRMQ